eukprot:SAG11_NODE_17970_length_503_cov_5.504950_1_plen_155_part_01
MHENGKGSNILGSKRGWTTGNFLNPVGQTSENSLQGWQNRPRMPTSVVTMRRSRAWPASRRRWIADYAKMTTPLNELLKKGIDVPSVWSNDPTRYDNSVKFLKHALTTYPILRQPNFHKEFVLYTDACDYAIGAALCQMYDDKPCVVSYNSRSLI